MPVKIRLTRMGKKKQPTYRVVMMDSRKPRDGAYIEQIGFYDPRNEPSIVEINNDRAIDWLQKGAQPTERAQKLLEISGAWTRFKVGKGEIHTVGESAPAAAPVAAPAPAPEEHTPEVHVVGGDEPAEEPAAEAAEETAVPEAGTEAPAAEAAAPADEAAAADEDAAKPEEES